LESLGKEVGAEAALGGVGGNEVGINDRARADEVIDDPLGFRARGSLAPLA
jgi:hypothetical protein